MTFAIRAEEASDRGAALVVETDVLALGPIGVGLERRKRQPRAAHQGRGSARPWFAVPSTRRIVKKSSFVLS